MTIRFYLRSTKKTAVPVWVRVRCGKGVDLSIPLSKAVIRPELWDSRRDSPRAFNKVSQPELYAESSKLSKYLESVRSEVVVAVDSCNERGVSFSREDLLKIAGREIKVDNAEDKAPRDIVLYAKWLIARMESGRFLNPLHSTRYDNDTIKTWKVSLRVLTDFREWYEKAGKVLTWSNIDKGVADAYVGYLESRGFTIKTRNKHIINLKALIRYAGTIDKVHDNLGCLEYIHRLKEEEGTATTKVYLNAKEVEALYNMPLEPGSLKDKVRDIFLCGVYTCQRVSDYNNLSQANFSTTARGIKVVRLVQEKTGTSVVIPILNDNLQAIAEKYNYELPRISDVIINRYIKDICKDLSKEVPSLAEPIKTILTLPEQRAEKEGRLTFERDEAGNTYKHKYSCVCTHTARRSGITNLYVSRLFTTAQIMSISGHKTESVFFEYVCQSSDEIAEEIAGIVEATREKRATNEGLF